MANNILYTSSQNENTVIVKMKEETSMRKARKNQYCPTYDYSALRGKIREVLKTERAYAKAIGRTQNYLSSVWKGASFFEQRDITLGAEACRIPQLDIGTYFFSLSSSQNENQTL